LEYNIIPFDPSVFYKELSKEKQREAIQDLIKTLNIGETAYLFLDKRLTKVEKISLGDKDILRILER
jgi:hypothetical protein